MNSQIFHGVTTHCRHKTRRHAFRYRMFWLAIDLDELPLLDHELRGFRYNRPALVSVKDRDYGGPGDGDIRKRAMAHLQSAGLTDPAGRIELMTIPRIAGYVFNPVNFYLFYSPDGQLKTLLAEVRNTLGEMHHYAAQLKPLDQANPDTLRCRIPKQFYVSPFFTVDGEYDVRVRRTDNEFHINISLHDGSGLAFTATMFGEGRPLTSPNLRRELSRLPFFAVTIMARIHWQALLLYFARRLSMIEKPDPSHSSTVPAAHPPWWLRLRAAAVRLASRRRPHPSLQSGAAAGGEDSQ